MVRYVRIRKWVGMSVLDNRVLVLNKDWKAVDVLNVKDAIEKVFAGRALFLDTETSATFDFEAWCENWTDAIDTAKIAASRTVSSPRFSFLLPDVIVCTEYRGFGYHVSHRKPKFSRTNIYRRDRNQCGFCGKKFHTEDLTIDHIIPKSKGGKMVWENVILACVPCNSKKGNKTVEEAGMRLVRKPYKPTPEDLRRNPIERILYKVGHKPPKTWGAFLSKEYWSVELKDG